MRRWQGEAPAAGGGVALPLCWEELLAILVTRPRPVPLLKVRERGCMAVKAEQGRTQEC